MGRPDGNFPVSSQGVKDGQNIASRVLHPSIDKVSVKSIKSNRQMGHAVVAPLSPKSDP